MKPIPIITCSHTPFYYSNFVSSVYQAATKGLIGQWVRSELDSSIVRHRSRTANYALRLAPDAQQFLWIDTDIGFSLDDCARLLRLPPSMEVVGGTYRMKMDDAVRYVYRQDDTTKIVEWEKDRDVVQVTRLGLGFVRMSRRALEYLVKTGEPTNAGWTVAFPEKLANGIWETEDYWANQRLIDAGFTIWMDRKIKLTHMGFKTYGE